MDKSRKIILASVGGVAVIGILVAAIAAGASAPEPTAAPAPSGSSSAVIPGEPSPSPSSAFPDPELHEDDVDGLELHSNENDEVIIDMLPYRKVAAAAVNEYVEFSSGESVDARAARLEPFFAAGSDYLTEEPNIANPQRQDAIFATVTVLKDGSPSAVPEESDGHLTFDVILTYEALYEAPGQNLSVTARILTWKVTMNKDFDGLVQEIEEPTNLR